jgi:hypothetical protein
MRFSPNEDQAAFLSVLSQMTEAPEAGWKASPDWSRFDYSASLDRMLEDNGFFECAREPTLGLVAAASMTWQLARVPALVECAASSMLRAIFAPDLPRPVAVIDAGLSQAVPFLPAVKSVIRLDGDVIAVARLEPGSVQEVTSLFAYPMGRLAPGADIDWETVEGDVHDARAVWSVATAAELAGCLKGGLDAVVKHVSERHQFGRPLGSFQAIQHRLAQAATKVEAAYWLALRAADRRTPADAALALGYVQEASGRIVQDLHQFMGAMGLTLEHPLHRWTYRARLLRAGLGGPTANLRAYYARKWTNS